MGWPATAAVVYACSSIALFLFPQLLHKRKRSLPSWRHISHRGGSGEELENTVAAFRHAIDAGTEMLEMDVHLTEDGEVVVCHDNDLSRLTGVNVSISSTEYDSLPQLRKCQELTFSKGLSTKVEHDSNLIPRLRQVFELFPGFPMNIDLKNGSNELIEKVHDLISEFKRESVTVWGSGSNSVSKKIYARNPSIPLFFSATRLSMVYLLLCLGLLPFWPLKESCFEFFSPSVIFERAGIPYSQLPRTVRFFLRFEISLLHRLVCFHLQRRGIKVYMWVLNQEEDFDLAMKLRVDGIMTDYPTRLSRYYDNYDARRAFGHGQ